MPIVPSFESFLLYIKDAGYKFGTAPFSSRPGGYKGAPWPEKVEKDANAFLMESMKITIFKETRKNNYLPYSIR